VTDMCATVYLSVYWNVDVLYRLYPYLAPTLLLLQSLTALSYTLLLYSSCRLFTRTYILYRLCPLAALLLLLLYSAIRTGVLTEIAELQPDARRGPRYDL
jgi:hypothetical protein